MNSRGARLARGSAAASTSTLVAAVSHAAGGGQFPHPLLLLAGLIFSVLCCVALTGRTVSWARLIAAVGFSQLLFHLLFSMSGNSTIQMVQSGHHVNPGLSVVGDAPVSAHSAHGNAWMPLAHVLAAVLTIAALRFGEAAFWSLFETARVSLSFLFRPSQDARIKAEPRPSLAVIGAGFQPRKLSHFLSCVQHRGPPPLALAA